MATVAYREKWYDSTAKFIQASKTLLKSQPPDFTDPEEFSKMLDTMTKQIVKMQNQLFSKRRTRVGTGEQTRKNVGTHMKVFFWGF